MAAVYLPVRGSNLSAQKVDKIIRAHLGWAWTHGYEWKDGETIAKSPNVSRPWFWEEGVERLLPLNRSQAHEVAQLLRLSAPGNPEVEVVAEFLENSGGIKFDL